MASNYQNINPKSRATPKEAPNPFKSYEEYASKRDEGEHFDFEIYSSDGRVPDSYTGLIDHGVFIVG
ncbi:hypothetical protein VP01_1203g3 [Puccinia sorghi]|uniref:Uncharacterized protein n=1 Tax=Puccinia sorghi TaxID=27349 RepID=A0A0L6VQI4_9BASI|nr:hypothetical protein VP01_1203g3 [Puccinia sorghi]